MSQLEKAQVDRKAVQLSGLALVSLMFQAIGIIYSDIGTSPLYTLNGIWSSSGPPPSTEDVIGGVSAIIWAITLLPLIKYVFITLEFGTGEGEGGTFALYQGLYPRVPDDFDADRTLTGESGLLKGQHKDSAPKLSERFRWPLLVWCLFGTSLTIADGIFTPAVSVTSAVSGIAVAQANVANDVVPISIALLVVLFLSQRFGTAKIGITFAPISCIWFALLLGTGAYNVSYYPGIFRAFDPSRAVLWFVRTGNYDNLAGVILAITGCEAVFANLGHFNKISIRTTFCAIVYPSIVLAYLGQGARLINDGPDVIGNVFYNTIPGPTGGGLYWIIFVFAILATIVASEAMITATFSLIQQLVSMKSLPPIRLIYTSETIQGQVYVPVINYALMIACIAVVGGFGSSTALTNAYGFSVATVMFSTTWLLAVQMRYVKGWPWIVGFGFLLIFGFFDGLFWGASLKKVPQGAWVPLMLGGLMMCLMLFWTWARGLEDKFDSANRRNLRSFIHVDHLEGEKGEILALGNSDAIQETEIDEKASSVETGRKDIAQVATYHIHNHANESDEIEASKKTLARIQSAAIFHKLSVGKGVPHSFVGFIRQWPAIPRVCVFMAVAVLPINRVPIEERYVVEKVRTLEGFYGCTYYLGFRDTFNIDLDDLIKQICLLESRATPADQLEAKLAEIRQVMGSITHIVPHYSVKSKPVSPGKVGAVLGWFRSLLVEGVYQRLSTMFPETVNWNTPSDEIIHVGISAHI